MLETMKFVRKPFNIDAVQITHNNMEDVAAWVSGTIQTDAANVKFVQVKVNRAANPRQTQGFVGDWVLRAGSGFKVYTNKSFKKDFEQVSVESTFHDVSPQAMELKNATIVVETGPGVEVTTNTTT